MVIKKTVVKGTSYKAFYKASDSIVQIAEYRMEETEMLHITVDIPLPRKQM